MSSLACFFVVFMDFGALSSDLADLFRFLFISCGFGLGKALVVPMGEGGERWQGPDSASVNISDMVLSVRFPIRCALLEVRYDDGDE